VVATGREMKGEERLTGLEPQYQVHCRMLCPADWVRQSEMRLSEKNCAPLM
jgi:hypothetical protein